VPVLHRKIGTIAVQNRLFWNAKQWVLQGVDSKLVR